jgi:hypothetical protein
MKLSEPKVITFIIAVVLGLLAILGAVITIPIISGIAFWLLVVAFILLALGNLLTGL